MSRLRTYSRRITKLIVISVLLSAIIGLILARILSKSQSRPLLSLFHQLGRIGVKEQVGSVSDAVQAILTSHTRLIESMEEQKPVVQAAVMGKMLRGEYHSEESLLRGLSIAGLSVNEDHHAACIVSSRFSSNLQTFDDSVIRETEAMGTVLRNILLEMGEAWTYGLHDGTIAIIISTSNTGETETNDPFSARGEEIIENLHKRGSMDCLVCIGPVVTSLLDISRSFDEASHMHIRINSEGNTGVFTFTEHSATTGPNSIDFPVSMENRISAAIKSGSVDSVQSSLTELFRQNSINEDFTDPLSETLYAQVVGMLYRTVRSLPNSDTETIFKRLESVIRRDNSHQRYVADLIDAAVELTRAFSRRQRSHNQILMDSMLSLIEENLSNPDLSLVMIADRCSITEVYASQFFKEQAGEQFSRYVERLRMGQARNLLGNRTLRIKEIALAVGFRNVNSFCRAFKRVTGSTPSQLRSIS